ncbi:MAG: HAD family phosphatase [Clostridia bacterium]|nr:HAD family phosphatase [Clostridia bacterium]
MQYTTYLFDFDGTLVDSMPAYIHAMLKILDDNHIRYGDDIIKTITPLGTKGTVAYYKKLGVPLSEDEILERMGRYAYDAYAHTIPAKENVKEVLRKLKENGADLNVLTASPHITLDICLKRLGLYDFFTNVWSSDDFGMSKANPEIYVKAAEKLGKPIESILFLDDNFNADKTAKSAGMKVCGVYDKSSEEYMDEIKAVTDYYIYNFSELLTLKEKN